MQDLDGTFDRPRSSANDEALRDLLKSIDGNTRLAVVQSTPILADRIGVEPERLRTEDDAPIFNPSVATDGEGLVFVARRSTGMAIRDRAVVYEDGAPHDTTNHLFRCDAQGRILGIGQVDDARTRQLHGIAELGLEDIRLFHRRGRLLGLCAGIARDGRKLRVTQLLVRFDGNRIADHVVLSSPFGASIEKNWVPLDVGDRTLLLHSLAPLRIMEIRDSRMRVVHGSREPNRAFPLRGGTPFLRVGNRFLGVAHHAPIVLDKLYYRHCFVVLDEKFAVVENSMPFFIQRPGIEFAAGLARVGEDFILSYGVADRAAFHLRFGLRALRRMLVTLA